MSAIEKAKSAATATNKEKEKKLPSASSKTSRKPVSGIKKKGKGEVAKASAAAPHHRLRKFTNYNVYIRNILKQTHADLGLKQRSVDVLNAIIQNMTEEVTREAVVFKSAAKRRTLSSLDIRLAVRLMFEPTLAKHVLLAVDKALDHHQRQRVVIKK